jgi:hypothetical protein
MQWLWPEATRDVHRLKKPPQSWGWFFARYSNVNFDISQREKKTQKSFIEIRKTEKLFLFKSWMFFFCWTWIPIPIGWLFFTAFLGTLQSRTRNEDDEVADHRLVCFIIP